MPRNRIYYLAVPPVMFAPTVKELARARLVSPPDGGPPGAGRLNGRFARLIVEEPIGRDLESARTINNEIAAVFDERQIYRIDQTKYRS